MRARLYGISFSHPSNAARLMLEHKGVDFEWVRVMPGMQAVQVRMAGFGGGTVPALRIDGRRVLGSRAISRVLEEIEPDPPLFPPEPEARAAVEAAEAWGDAVLQPVPRRMLRWAIRRDRRARERFAAAAIGPRSRLVAPFVLPAAIYYARREDARSTQQIRADWQALPGHLDHVDELIATGVIGGTQLNAADFQIGTTVRIMEGLEDCRPLIAGRPAGALGRRVWPECRFGLPSLLPREIREA